MQKKIARSESGLLDLSAEVWSVEKTCRVMGYFHQKSLKLRCQFRAFGPVRRMVKQSRSQDSHAGPLKALVIG